MYCPKHDTTTHWCKTCRVCELEDEITRLIGELRNAEYRALNAPSAVQPAQPAPFHDAIQMTKPM